MSLIEEYTNNARLDTVFDLVPTCYGKNGWTYLYPPWFYNLPSSGNSPIKFAIRHGSPLWYECNFTYGRSLLFRGPSFANFLRVTFKMFNLTDAQVASVNTAVSDWYSGEVSPEANFFCLSDCHFYCGPGAERHEENIPPHNHFIVGTVFAPFYSISDEQVVLFVRQLRRILAENTSGSVPLARVFTGDPLRVLTCIAELFRDLYHQVPNPYNFKDFSIAHRLLYKHRKCAAFCYAKTHRKGLPETTVKLLPYGDPEAVFPLGYGKRPWYRMDGPALLRELNPIHFAVSLSFSVHIYNLSIEQAQAVTRLASRPIFRDVSIIKPWLSSARLNLDPGSNYQSVILTVMLRYMTEAQAVEFSQRIRDVLDLPEGDLQFGLYMRSQDIIPKLEKLITIAERFWVVQPNLDNFLVGKYTTSCPTRPLEFPPLVPEVTVQKHIKRV